ncbi:hypothetical protein J2S97_003830 [Arthrobacter oryzae]|nr:hypothetical protein [Arthrobacter oryzae]
MLDRTGFATRVLRDTLVNVEVIASNAGGQ